MTIYHLAEMTWTEVRDLPRAHLVALLPLGAVEAHGPHLPVSTDPIISAGMAEEGARRLSDSGLNVLLLPPVDYTAADFAAGFPGTISVRPETVTALLTDIAMALAAHGLRWLALVNSHFDPVHLGSIYAAIRRVGEESDLEIIFPDVTRKPWALRLTDEFKSGACHAGQYEGSIVMVCRPELVREEIRKELSPNPQSLSVAIRDGFGSFQEAGGPDAYFGSPAAASAEEGATTVAVLGEILAEAVLEVVEKQDH
jgi:creatinine amidohydrolase